MAFDTLQILIGFALDGWDHRMRLGCRKQMPRRRQRSGHMALICINGCRFSCLSF